GWYTPIHRGMRHLPVRPPPPGRFLHNPPPDPPAPPRHHIQNIHSDGSGHPGILSAHSPPGLPGTQCVSAAHKTLRQSPTRKIWQKTDTDHAGFSSVSENPLFY